MHFFSKMSPEAPGFSRRGRCANFVDTPIGSLSVGAVRR